MIRQKIILEKYDDWVIYAYYAVSTYYTDEIMEHLYHIGIDEKTARKAYRNLSKGDLDSGLCYSNREAKETVLVVALTSSTAEFFNSITHEVAHCCNHIAEEMGIDHRGEEYAYLVGDLSMEMYPKIKSLLCECCKTKKYRSYGSY